MWSLGNHKRRLLAVTVAAAAMLVLYVVPVRGDVAHDDRLEQDPKIYLPLVIKRYCPDGWQDDFSDPTSGWPVSDAEWAKLEYLAGEFHALIKQAHFSVVFGPLSLYATNFTLEVDGRGDLATYGLMFGGNAGEWYWFEVQPGNYWAVLKFDVGGIWGEVLDSGYSSYITSGMNRLKIIRDGSLIKAYVNGHLLSTVTDSSFLGSRGVGLMAGAEDTAPVDAYFDNFWVCPVDSAPGVGAAGMGQAIILQKGTPPTIEFWPR